MLYYIDRSVAATIRENGLSETEICFFDQIALASRLGKCFLCGDSDSLECLGEVMGSRYKGVFKSVLAKRAEYGAVMQAVFVVFVLSFSETGTGVALPDVISSPGKCVFIPIRKAIDLHWNLGVECNLLCENLTDTSFYRIIGDSYCSRHNYGKIQMKFRNVHGGGGTTATVFRECIEIDKTPTLCIIDSDRKYGPTARFPDMPPIGDTLIAVKSISSALEAIADHTPFYLYELQVHEAENLIPISVLSRLKQPNAKKGIERLQKMRNNGNGEAILYYDFKKGFLWISEEEKRQYWLEIILSLGGKVEEMPPAEKPQTNPSQSNIYFPPVGKKTMLSDSVMSMKEHPSFELDEYLRDIWDDIGKAILTWGCVCEPLRG